MGMGNIAETIFGNYTLPQMLIAAVFYGATAPSPNPLGPDVFWNWKSQNFERFYGTYTEYLYNTPWEGWVTL